MSKEMEIEVITYEQERLDYFTKLMTKAQKRYKRLFEKHQYCGYMSAEYQLLCDAGRKAHFHGDVVEMLEKGCRKQSEGEWIDKHCTNCGEELLFERGGNVFATTFHQYKTKYCPNCGAKMKGGADE